MFDFFKKNKPKKFNQRVSCTLRKNDLFLCAQSKPSGGGWFWSDPFLMLDGSASAQKIGETILEAKQGSIEGYEVNMRDFVSPFYEMAGAKNYSSFARKTKFVSIDFLPEKIELFPNRNEKGTYYGIPDKKRYISANSSAEEIGQALMQAFDDCEVI